MSRFHPRPPEPPKERGAHTLDVFEGTIVGVYGGDVFVELGPRKQGIIARHAFLKEPAVGEVHRFTLRGRDENLWVLNLLQDQTLDVWEDLEEGSLTSARIVHLSPDGFQLKIGPLHAYMPFSESGVRKRKDRPPLVGRGVVVEVLSVDPDKQRAVVSRKSVLKMQRDGRSPGAVVPGQTVSGRVTRIESYGVFVRLGNGREGLCHVSNLSVDRVDHPSEVVKKGDILEARVLFVRAGGKRIGLGVKQLEESPWTRLEREHWCGQIVEVDIVRVGTFGAVARMFAGAEGIVPASECGDRTARRGLAVKDRMSARILELDPDAERLAFSLVHSNGRPIERDEAETLSEFAELRERPEVKAVLGASGTDAAPAAPASTNVGDLLRKALGGDGT